MPLVGMLCACSPAGPAREHVAALFSMDAKRDSGAPASAEWKALGAALFALPTEVEGHATSCRGCHDPDRHGQDGQQHLVRSCGRTRSTPALQDCGRALLLGWGGTVADLPAMITRELADQLAIADDASVRIWLQSPAARSIGLDRLVERVVPTGTGPTVSVASQALAAHVATLRSRGRWDRYVDGDDTALTSAEKAGLATFLRLGCASCHAGRNLGGASVHKLGAARAYECSDAGRELRTHRPEDRHVFRAPMLRLVAHTAPYLHDGSIPDLPAMIRLMTLHELGTTVSDAEVRSIEAFLRAVGELDP